MSRCNTGVVVSATIFRVKQPPADFGGLKIRSPRGTIYCMQSPGQLFAKRVKVFWTCFPNGLACEKVLCRRMEVTE